MYSRRFRIKGWSHKICFRGFLGGKEESLLFDVKWFSGSVVFRNALLLCGVCTLASKTLWCCWKQEEDSTGMRKVGKEKIWLGDGNERGGRCHEID